VTVRATVPVPVLIVALIKVGIAQIVPEVVADAPSTLVNELSQVGTATGLNALSVSSNVVETVYDETVPETTA
jgi:hypothetical protein